MSVRTGREWRVCACGLVALLLLSRVTAVVAGETPGRIAQIDSLETAGLRDSALALIGREIPRAEAECDSGLLVMLWLRQGNLLNRRGQAREAELVLRLAERAAWSRNDTASTCRALQILSASVASQGRAGEARDLAERLLHLAEASGDRVRAGWARVDLGRDAWLNGRSDEAIDQCRLAIALFHAAGERRGEAWTQNGLGTALSGLGRYDEARLAFQAAARLGGETDDAMVRVMAANNLGALEHILGDPAAAVVHFAESVRLNRAGGRIRESIVPGANLALCNSDLGRYQEAADSLEALLTICRREGFDDVTAIVLNRLADTRALQGRTTEARSLYRQVIALDASVAAKNRVDAFKGLAQSLAASDSAAAARTLLEDAVGELGDAADIHIRIDLEIQLGELLAEGETPGEAVHLLRRAARNSREMGVSVRRERALIGLARAWAASGVADSAAACWREAAVVWEEVRSLTADPEWRESRGDWGRALATELTSLRLGAGTPDGPGVRAATDRDPDAAREAYETAQAFKARTLLERMTGYAQSPAIPLAPPSLLRLQTEILRPGELLLDIYLGPHRSWLFAVTVDSIRACRLPAGREIEAKVRFYRDLLRTPATAPGGTPAGQPAATAAAEQAAAEQAATARATTVATAALDRAGELLHALLFGQVEDLVASHRRVFVAPDGWLNLIPLGQPCGATRGDQEWIRIPSAAVLDLLHSRGASAPSSARILALASNTVSGVRLRGAREEIGRIARRYSGVRARALDPGDTLRWAELAGPVDILHLAAHATTSDERPWQSALELGASRLRAVEIASVRLPARLAVLSACETQYGNVATGEGVLGLSTALLCAGCDCVVATLWPVEDRAAARFMAAFYEHVAEGIPVAGALRAAQAALQATPETAHPFYWAGFVAIGRGDAAFPLRRRPVPWLVPAGLAAAGLLGLALVWSRRRAAGSRVIEGGQGGLMG